MNQLIRIIFILTVFEACSSLNHEVSSSDPILMRTFPVTFKNGQLYDFESKDYQGSVTRFEFDSHEKAKSYAMERRLLILRKFEVLIEPYFGTANAKDCENNLKSGYLDSSDKKFSALLQLPVNGPARTIHDCLTKNNSHWANIQFLVCDRHLYDIRTYADIFKKEAYEPKFRCR